jgi:hypothetical protein
MLLPNKSSTPEEALVGEGALALPRFGPAILSGTH